MKTYKQFFSLTGAPFTRALPLAAVLAYRDFAQLQAGLHTLVEDGGIGVLTGDVGMGKSTAVRAFAAGLDPLRVPVLYLPYAEDIRSLLRKLATLLGLTPAFLTGDLRLQLGDALLGTYRRNGHRTLLVADEAHRYTEAQLTEVRLLTQLGMEPDDPVALLLVGQPALRKNVKRPSQLPLRQRLTFFHSVVGLSREETTAYVAAHLQAVGGDPALFPVEVLDRAWTESGGVPRALNQLLNQTLQRAAWRDENPITLDAFEAVLDWFKDFSPQHPILSCSRRRSRLVLRSEHLIRAKRRQPILSPTPPDLQAGPARRTLDRSPA
jgi:type II secretory pathway predicted ATPase ExeA